MPPKTAENTEKTTPDRTAGQPKAGADGSNTQSAATGTLQLKYVRSVICAPFKQKRVVKGLGFTRLNQVIEREDTPSIRGMVAKVPHLVEIIPQAEPAGAARK